MHASPLRDRHTLVVAIVLTITLAGFANNAHSQATANGAVWVDTTGNVVGPALGNDMILLKIPSVGNIVVLVNTPVFPTTLGDPIRWKYSINTDLVPEPTIVMRFQSSDCTDKAMWMCCPSTSRAAIQFRSRSSTTVLNVGSS